VLTAKQAKLLHLLDDHIGQTGVAPSFDEMAEAMGLAAKSGIDRLILGLEDRGYIRRIPGKARAIEVLRTGQGQIRVDADTWSSVKAALNEGQALGSDLCRQVSSRIGGDPSHAEH